MIDVIIVNYNSTDYLIECLKSIEHSLNGIRAYIYVQDNASTDGVEKIKAIYPKVILTQNRRNIGFAAAVNQALARGKNPYVVLLNPDAVVLDHFFAICIDYLKKNPRAGIVGPKVLEKDGGLQNSARTFPTFLTALFGRTSFLSKLFPGNSISRQNLPSLDSNGYSPIEVDWVSGACMVVRREAIERVGGLDRRFFLYWEDADWCARMWEAGWKVVYYPRAVVRHFTGVSSGRKLLRSVFEFHKSAFRLYEKRNEKRPSFILPFIAFGLFFRSGLLLAAHTARKLRRGSPGIEKTRGNRKLQQM